MLRRCSVLLIVTAMLAGACSGDDAEPTTTVTVPSTTATTTTTTIPPTTTTTTTTTLPDEANGGGLQPRFTEPFASLVAVPLVDDTPRYAGPASPTSLDGIYVPTSMLVDLDGRSIATLEAQGFVVVPGHSDLFHPLYQEIHYEGEVYFVTTDVGYHYLHLAFSKVLRTIEQEQLLPILEALVIGLVDAARTQRDDLAGTVLEDAADRVAQLYEAAATVLELDVGPIGDLAEQEVALALEASRLVTSPITGLGSGDPEVSMEGLVDFSLFKPRGHYTRNGELERYFRAMSVLGNENFSVGRGDTMALAALATRVLVEDPALLEAWQLIYEPTAFLVGLADDYTPTELADRLDTSAPGWRDDPSAIDLDVAAAAGRALVELRPVGIDPEAASVRIMGVRFVVDSYIYDQLRFPSVGDPPYGRIYATPLDLVATFGSDLAYEIMEEDGTLTDPDTGERWTNYDDQLALLAGMIDEREPDDWAATVYDAWLYALEPVWRPLGEAYPDFMRTDAWEVKDLQTGLGSYTELKHDTILYAKQSFAAEGDYEPIDYPEPRHWVEPNPVAFARMAAVLGLMEDGLSERGLLPSDGDSAELITALGDFLERLARLAADELEGRPISAEDNEWLRAIGSAMEALWIRSADLPDELTGDFPDQDVHAALVADIMRTSYAVLEIGTGLIDTLYVLVPDDAGRFQIAKGGVYSYYEFWRAADDGRLTDEEWWELLITEPPDRPGWQEPIFPSAAVYDVGLAAGLNCWQLSGQVTYPELVAYWVAYGMPGRLDWDATGMPCSADTSIYDPSYFAGLPDESGLFCRDLLPEGYSFAQAVAYWLVEGAPDRMDADGNGIPCETVYPTAEIEAFFTIGSGG